MSCHGIRDRFLGMNLKKKATVYFALLSVLLLHN